ncbi:MAG: hypothetical protein AAF697_04505 [Pseudomonadota bacterium]
MTLFAPDLFRSFAFGFVAGALVLGAVTIGDWAPHLESPANAAEVQSVSAPALADEFKIVPLGE